MSEWYNTDKGYPIEITSAHWKTSGCFDLNWEALIPLWSSSLIHSQLPIIIYTINHRKVLRNTTYVDHFAMANVNVYDPMKWHFVEHRCTIDLLYNAHVILYLTGKVDYSNHVLLYIDQKVCTVDADNSQFPWRHSSFISTGEELIDAYKPINLIFSPL